MGNKLLILTFLALISLSVGTSAETLKSGDLNDLLEVKNVEVDGADLGNIPLNLEDTNNVQIARGEEIDIEFDVAMKNSTYAIEDVEVEVRLARGYRYSDDDYEMLYDMERFDLDEDSSENLRLTIEVPVDLDVDDNTFLHITIGAQGQFLPISEVVKVNIEGVDESDAVRVDRVSFSPSVVKAGFGFTTLVRVENYGEDDFDDVCAEVRVVGVPGAVDTECLEDLDADETETLEEFAIRIPEGTRPGVYDVRTTVEFDRSEETTYLSSIEVIADEDDEAKAEVKLSVSVPESIEVAAGANAVYPITLSNDGSNDATVVLSATNVGTFGTATFQPSNLVILREGETKTVMLNIAVAEAATGVQTFLLNVEADGDNKQIALMTSVVGNAGTDDLRRGLEIGLIVLVIILIILGLIVGFTRMKKNDGEDETQTYY